MRKSKGARLRAKVLKIANRTKEKAAGPMELLNEIEAVVARKYSTAIKRSNRIVTAGLNKLCSLLDTSQKKKKIKKSKKGGIAEKKAKNIKKIKKGKRGRPKTKK